jgi:hypothetical protein
MTWPTSYTNPSTTNLDSGGDSPASARADLKDTVDLVNIMANTLATSGVTAATYGNTQQIPSITFDALGRATTATASYPALRRYSEPVYAHTTTTGNVTVDFNNGNFQTLTATGNITLSFANAPTAGTATLVFVHGGAARTVTFPAANIKYAGGISTVSISNTTDMIVATTLDSGSNYLVSIVRGFA